MKIAVVTGASSGMGREFVKQLSAYVQVDEIWAIARRKDALEALGRDCGLPVRAVPMDLCDSGSFAAYRSLLEAEKPEVKLLVNAAGFGKFGAFDEVPLEEDCRMVDLNAKALVVMTRLTLPYLQPGSHVLQLDSLSAFQPVPYIAVYGATKAFVLSYSRALNVELKGRGIRMMTLNPGWVKTEFFDHAFQTNRSQVQNFSPLYEADYVVAKGLRALYRSRKDVCVPGLPVRAQTWLVKLLPHKLVMQIWLAQQKKPKNNTVLTTK